MYSTPAERLHSFATGEIRYHGCEHGTEIMAPHMREHQGPLHTRNRGMGCWGKPKSGIFRPNQKRDNGESPSEKSTLSIIDCYNNRPFTL